jgi:DNA-binding GntR family transcriptional regulator
VATDLKPAREPRRSSAALRAYDYVKTRLLDGRYAGGLLLSENEVARQLGMSRTPVRQAFVNLEAEGLLELYPRRGALVRPITASEADDVLEARLLIESHCAKRVARYGHELTEALEASLAEQERTLREDPAGFAIADRKFHRSIVAANGNALLTQQYDALRDRQQRITAAAAALDPVRVAGFINEHRAIAAAVESGDADAASELITTHLLRAYELARRPHSDYFE